MKGIVCGATGFAFWNTETFLFRWDAFFSLVSARWVGVRVNGLLFGWFRGKNNQCSRPALGNRNNKA